MDTRSQLLTSYTWNVHGLRKRCKLKRVFAAIKTLSFPDIICFQEIHSDEYWAYHIKKTFKLYNVYISHGTSRSRGVALLVKRTLMFTIKQTIIDPEGRFVLLKGDLNRHFFTFGSIYAPADFPESRRIFFNKLLQLDLGVNHLLLGDYNSVGNHRMDRSRLTTNDDGNEEYLDFLQFSNSKDSWRELHPNDIVSRFNYSYARHRQHGPFSRIDHALITADLIKNVKVCSFISDFRVSDHKLLKTVLDIGPQMIGHDFKKLKPDTFSLKTFQEGFLLLWNNKLEQFDSKIRYKIKCGLVSANTVFVNGSIDFTSKSVLQHLELNNIWWENFKKEICELGFKVQRGQAMKHNREAKTLVTQLQKAKNPVLRSNIEKRLNKVHAAMTQKVWQEFEMYDRLKNETCCNDFFKLFNLDQKSLFIGDLYEDPEDLDKLPITQHKDKVQYLVQKYTDLYNIQFPILQSEDRFLEYFKFASLVPKVPEDFVQNTGDITVDELEFVVNKALDNKCPGLDGLPVAFYKKNLSKIKHVMTEVFNNIYETGNSPESWLTALIKLIPKKEGKISFNKLRPLKMIVNDCKLYCDVIMLRVGELLQFLINDFQSGGVKGRSANASIMLVHLLFHYCAVRKESGFVFSIDNKNAFDRVNWEFQFFCLRCYGIDEKIVSAIENLYKDNYSKISVNGYFSESFPVTNGVRQGCPLSGPLYVLGVEPLARKVLDSILLESMTIPNLTNIRIIQHIDDQTFFLKNAQSIRTILGIISDFNIVFGSELNYSKSVIIEMGYTGAGYDIGGIPVLGESQFHKILGVYFGSIIDKYVDYNWTEKIKKLEELVKFWKKEKLTLVGRSIIVNLKILSKIFYTLSILQLPSHFADKINALIYKILNKGKIGISLNNLTLSKLQGGIGVVNIINKAESLKLNFMQHCYFPRDDDPLILKSVGNILQYFLNKPLFRVSNEHMSILGPAYGGSTAVIQTFSFFFEMFKTFQHFLKLKIDYNLSTMPSKDYYKLLQKSHVSDVTLGNFVVDPAEVNKIWKNIFLKIFDNKVMSLNYRLAYNKISSLSTYPTLHGRDTWCPYCRDHEGISDQIEDLQHIFINCSIAFQVWDFLLAKMIQGDLPLYGHSSYQGVLYLDKMKILYKYGVSTPENILISEVNFMLWRNRCVNVFEHKLNGPLCVIAMLKYKLKVMSGIQRKRLSSVQYNLEWANLNALITKL